MNKIKSALWAFLLALGLLSVAKRYQYQTVEGDTVSSYYDKKT